MRQVGEHGTWNPMYTQGNAEDTILGYCYGGVPLRLKTRPRWYGRPLHQTHRSRYAYAVFDCLPASVGGLDWRDVLVVSGIDARLTGSRIVSIMRVASEVSECLDQIDALGGRAFWELDPEELTADPPEGSQGWWMSSAWSILMRLWDIDVAITHKILHHKRPTVFPLIDSRTSEYLGANERWVKIHDDLTLQADQFESLVRWHADQVRAFGGGRLSRLRMHDILLWCRASGEDKEARRLGAEIRKDPSLAMTLPLAG